MIVTFFGHAQILQREEIEKWLYVVTENLIEQGAITFYLGGYGAFDSLAASVLKAQCKCQRKSEPGAHEKVSHKRPRKSEPERSRIVDPVC